MSNEEKVILDRDGLFFEQLMVTLRSSGTKIVHSSIQAPNMNVLAERVVLPIKSEFPDPMIFVSGDSLDPAICEFATHYHAERHHRVREECSREREMLELENHSLTVLSGEPLIRATNLAWRER